jgi:hypothetical protein
MPAHTSFFIALLAFLCGCSDDGFTTGRGDVGQFILQRAAAYRGSPISTNGLPAIRGRWRYSEDEHGVIINLSRQQYPAVETLLREAFGQPQFGPVDTSAGGKLGEYSPTSKGGAIQFSYDIRRTQVIVLRLNSHPPFSQKKASDSR